MMRTPQQIILGSVVTQKTTDLTGAYVEGEEAKDAKAGSRVLTLAVALDANKIEIKKAVEELFKVKVDKVRVLRMPGKIRKDPPHAPENLRPYIAKQRRRSWIGRASDWKKAYVKLAPGQELPAVFEA